MSAALTTAQERWLTIRQAAQSLGVSIETVRRLCLTGQLQSAAIGAGARRHRRVRPEWIDDFSRRCRAADLAGRARVPAAPRPILLKRNPLYE